MTKISKISICFILNKIRVQSCFQTLKTRSNFKNKDPVLDGFSSKIVYECPYERCPERYVGETMRHLETGINNHIRGRPVPSEVTLHRHEMSATNFLILNPLQQHSSCLNVTNLFASQ